MNRVISIFMTVLLVTMVFSGCANQEYKEKYNFALDNVASRNYEEAIQALEEIADEYEEAEELINKIHYARGCELFNQKSYAAACSEFESSDYNNSYDLQSACHYFEARKLINNKKYGEAINHLNNVSITSEYNSDAQAIYEKIFNELIDGQWHNQSIDKNVTVFITKFMNKVTVTDRNKAAVESYDVTFSEIGRIVGKYSSSSISMNIEFLSDDRIEISGSCTLGSLTGTYSNGVNSVPFLGGYVPEGENTPPVLQVPSFVE